MKGGENRLMVDSFVITLMLILKYSISPNKLPCFKNRPTVKGFIGYDKKQFSVISKWEYNNIMNVCTIYMSAFLREKEIMCYKLSVVYNIQLLFG